MRIDVVQPAPIPEIPKTPQGSGTSTNYDSSSSQSTDQAVRESGTKKGSLNGSSLEKTAEEINSSLQLSDKKIQFKILKDPNRVITQVIDSETNEVIEEIPPEKMVEIADAIIKSNSLGIDKQV